MFDSFSSISSTPVQLRISQLWPEHGLQLSQFASFCIDNDETPILATLNHGNSAEIRSLLTLNERTPFCGSAEQRPPRLHDTLPYITFIIPVFSLASREKCKHYCGIICKTAMRQMLWLYLGPASVVLVIRPLHLSESRICTTWYYLTIRSGLVLSCIIALAPTCAYKKRTP